MARVSQLPEVTNPNIKYRYRSRGYATFVRIITDIASEKGSCFVACVRKDYKDDFTVSAGQKIR